jgi:hypothetical protein
MRGTLRGNHRFTNRFRNHFSLSLIRGAGPIEWETEILQ